MVSDLLSPILVSLSIPSDSGGPLQEVLFRRDPGKMIRLGYDWANPADGRSPRHTTCRKHQTVEPAGNACSKGANLTGYAGGSTMLK